MTATTALRSTAPEQEAPRGITAPHWRDAAFGGLLLPCQREDLQLWFSERPADLELAKAYCRSCPLRAPCLTGATERGEPHGVWGGEIFERGAITSSKRPRGRPPRASAR